MNIAFSQVLSEPRFRSIEKIKTIKSTYMAAAGLRPEYEVKQTKKQTNSALRTRKVVGSPLRKPLLRKNILSKTRAGLSNNTKLPIHVTKGNVNRKGSKRPIIELLSKFCNTLLFC